MDLEGIVFEAERLTVRQRADAGMAEDQEPGFSAAVIGETPSNLHRLGT